MLTLNHHPSHLARAAAVHAMTDVTGFALLGHASEVAVHSNARLVIEASEVPLLTDAHRFAAAGAITSGGNRNREQLGDRVSAADGLDDSLVQLLFDPQTSGGLLIALPEADAEPLRAAIEAETGGCWHIGSVEDGPPLVAVR
jgi:selenide,water dikinase